MSQAVALTIVGAILSLVLTVFFAPPLQKFRERLLARLTRPKKARSQYAPLTTPPAPGMVKVRIIKEGMEKWDTKYGQYAACGQEIYVKKEASEKGVKKGHYCLVDV